MNLIIGPPTSDLVESIRYTLECELWHRERQAKQKPQVWNPKVKEIELALENLELLEKRAK